MKNKLKGGGGGVEVPDEKGRFLSHCLKESCGDQDLYLSTLPLRG